MLKNITLGLMGVFALTLFTFPAFAQEERELTIEEETPVLYQDTAAPTDDKTTSSDDYQQLYDNLDDYYTTGDYNYDNLTPDEQAALAGFSALTGGLLLIVVGVSSVVGLILYIYMSLAYMTIAKRLNMENAWWAWVPVLNLILMAQIGDVNPWTLLLVLVPVVNVFYLIYFIIVTSMKMSEKLGLDKMLGLLMLIPVVNYVFLGYLAWGKFEKKAAK